MFETIDVPVRDPALLREVLPIREYRAFERGARRARPVLDGRVVWNVNSTASGGGVVELLRPLVGYARGLGIDARWAVIDAGPAFFEITKRIHNRLHGFAGDEGPLGEDERREYEDALAANVTALAPQVGPNDVVILHDPQTAGMAASLRKSAAAVIWRCHVGIDRPNELAREAWAFLQPYVRDVDAYVFSRESFVWDGLDRSRVALIAPTIDVFTPKNEELAPETVHAVLAACGLVDDGEADAGARYRRQDGELGRIERRVTSVEDEPLRFETPIVVQVSRWDALKDPVGVIRGFADHVPSATGAQLVYAGPSVDAVADDPEGARVLQASIEARSSLPAPARSRVHLAALPMADPDENAVIVNALQRHARVVVQKSLAEGFGLTVAEAMWKARPVVASRVGGIAEQIVHDVSGVLLDDPRDLATFGAAVTGLLADTERAERIGRNAHERVRAGFLSARSLLDYLDLVGHILQGRHGRSTELRHVR